MLGDRVPASVTKKPRPKARQAGHEPAISDTNTPPSTSSTAMAAPQRQSSGTDCRRARKPRQHLGARAAIAELDTALATGIDYLDHLADLQSSLPGSVPRAGQTSPLARVSDGGRGKRRPSWPLACQCSLLDEHRLAVGADDAGPGASDLLHDRCRASARSRVPPPSCRPWCRPSRRTSAPRRIRRPSRLLVHQDEGRAGDRPGGGTRPARSG